VPELDGRAALVSGASRGIGRAIALELADGGAVVGVNYVRGEGAANEVVEAITGAGGRAVALQGDVADPEHAKALVASAEEALGDLEILVCNAGITRDNLIALLKPEDWQSVIDINLAGTFWLCQAASRRMMRRRRGAIVAVSSVVGTRGNPGQTNYAAAKAGQIGLVKALARELGSRQVRVNAVTPGYVDTEITQALTDDQRAGILEATPLGRLGEPSDVAKAVRFLVSDSASFVTGAVLGVDGGLGM
jgi:3-oxoacyl-[acyl-carrier protein] reductase